MCVCARICVRVNTAALLPVLGQKVLVMVFCFCFVLFFYNLHVKSGHWRAHGVILLKYIVLSKHAFLISLQILHRFTFSRYIFTWHNCQLMLSVATLPSHSLWGLSSFSYFMELTTITFAELLVYGRLCAVPIDTRYLTYASEQLCDVDVTTVWQERKLSLNEISSLLVVVVVI